MIYLDNAATSFPKPPALLEKMVETYRRLGCSPGRGGYDLAVEALEFVEETRRKIARFFNAPDPSRMVFAANATDALNLVIQGLVRPGDHVVSTRLEHNSVLRPLYHLKQRGVIDYDLVPFGRDGFVDPGEIARAIRPETRLVVMNHASNVLGTIQPVAEVGRVCRERGIPLVIDAAQSAGQTPIDLTAWDLSAVAFTGHKALLGPTGIGGLVLAPDLDVTATRYGGTGVDSARLVHTRTFPHRLEAGTLNLIGIIGLSLGLDYLARHGPEAVRARELELAQRLHRGLAGLEGVTLYGPCPDERHVSILVCNMNGKDPEDVGAILDADFGIAVRTGLHCAPLVAADLPGAARGTVRFSLGPFNDEADVDSAVRAMSEIAGSG